MGKTRILVTGLCLSRNRGGSAMAISFINQIQKYIPAEFLFAVDPRYIDLERQWAQRYGVEIVPRNTILQTHRLSPLLQSMLRLRRRIRCKATEVRRENFNWRSIHDEYVKAFERADCVVSLQGISFVGDGTRSWVNSLAERTESIYAKKAGKPFFRFIQSYGPFEDWRVKLLAKLEFKTLPCVMARGRLASGYCKGVAGDLPVYEFPDVAITLPYVDNSWLYEYLEKFSFRPKDYIVLSPSAVIAGMVSKDNSSVGDNHVLVYGAIAKHYLSNNKKILFLPHMTSPDSTECDRAVCRQVLRMLATQEINTAFCHVVVDELDCRELKALIKGAELAIVSRYHALVAALSTGIPAVSIGWNDKYQDLLDFYKSRDFAVDGRMGGPQIVSEAVLKKANSWTNERIEILKSIQPELEDMVSKASKICAEWILGVTK